MWLFYIPVVFFIVILTLIHRKLSFTAVNPGLPGSGFIGENKSLSLLSLQRSIPERVAKTAVIASGLDITAKVESCEQFISSNELDYPVILKPDFGQRGIGVEIINDAAELKAYLQESIFDTVLQEYIRGVEFGVFYIRNPEDSHGYVFSLTHKNFPYITGDGVSTLEELIFAHPRLQFMAESLLQRYADQLDSVLKDNEVLPVIRLGTHRLGSLFLEGGQYLTNKVSSTIDEVSRSLEGFYFGRYDVRAESIEAFQQGNFKVIEVNGVTSESTNIYDPKYSVFKAYQILFKQWKQAFAIGKKNISEGYQPMGISDLITKVKIMNR